MKVLITGGSGFIGYHLSNYLLKKKHKILSCINQVGSMLSVHLNISKVENYTDACVANNALFKKLFHGLISRGVYFAPSAFESLFISYSHNLKLLKKTVDSFNKTIKEII